MLILGLVLAALGFGLYWGYRHINEKDSRMTLYEEKQEQKKEEERQKRKECRREVIKEEKHHEGEKIERNIEEEEPSLQEIEETAEKVKEEIEKKPSPEIIESSERETEEEAKKELEQKETSLQEKLKDGDAEAMQRLLDTSLKKYLEATKYPDYRVASGRDEIEIFEKSIYIKNIYDDDGLIKLKFTDYSLRSIKKKHIRNYCLLEDCANLIWGVFKLLPIISKINLDGFMEIINNVGEKEKRRVVSIKADRQKYEEIKTEMLTYKKTVKELFG